MEKDVALKPMARLLARELTVDEIELIAGAGPTDPGTIALDRQLDDLTDHWLPA